MGRVYIVGEDERELNTLYIASTWACFQIFRTLTQV